MPRGHYKRKPKPKVVDYVEEKMQAASENLQAGIANSLFTTQGTLGKGVPSEYNQVTYLNNKVNCLKDKVRGLESEILQLYRRLYQADKPYDSCDD